MRRTRPWPAISCVAVLFGALAAGGITTSARASDAPERWTATSTTAISITGNITFSPGRIVFQNGRALPLAAVGRAAAFRDADATLAATVYRVTTPADPLLLNGNRLCGGAAHALPVTYLAIWIPQPLPGEKAPRTMAAFSGHSPPRSSDGAGACGTYSYDAGG